MISQIKSYSQSHKQMEQAIRETVIKIEQAAAERNNNLLNSLLHEDYRVIANRFKGSNEVTIISKGNYLVMMKNGKIGGTKYSIEFNQINITSHTAIVDLTYKSESEPDMHKYLVLIQNEENSWEVISDIPLVLE